MNSIPEVAVFRINDMIMNRQEAIISGAVKDFEEYKYLVGIIQGLSHAKNEITALLELNNEEE